MFIIRQRAVRISFQPPSIICQLATSRSVSIMGSIGIESEPAIYELKKKVDAWQQPGPAAYDFRSDVVTTPTPSMLEAIVNTTLLDDVFMEDTTTTSLEADIAALAGHDAGLLVMSGTMGNQVALRTHLTQPPHSVLCDHRAHIIVYEAGGVSSLTGATVHGIVPTNGCYLTLADIKEHVVIDDDVHACPTKVISLENTLRGIIMPLDEVRRISAFAREHDIKMHLDGARLWEVAAAGAGSLSEYGKCFDSISLCFSKGLGAPIGSLIVSSKPFIKHARRIRKSIGGGTRQSGIISAAAAVAVKESFGHGPNGEGGKLRESHARAKKIEGLWKSKGGDVAHSVETNMVWLDLEGRSNSNFIEIASKYGLKTGGGRLVVHYQICDDAVLRLSTVMDEWLATR